MTFIAHNMDLNQIVHSAHFDEKNWNDLKVDNRDKNYSLFTCISCNSKLVLATSPLNTNFFRHLHDSSTELCARITRDQLHDHLEFLIQRVIFKLGYEADLEFRMPFQESHRRSDISIKLGDKRIAIEIQLSKQTPEDYKKRTIEYKEAGVDELFWIIRSHGPKKDKTDFIDIPGFVFTNEDGIRVVDRKELQELTTNKPEDEDNEVFFDSVVKEKLKLKNVDHLSIEHKNFSYYESLYSTIVSILDQSISFIDECKYYSKPHLHSASTCKSYGEEQIRKQEEQIRKEKEKEALLHRQQRELAQIKKEEELRDKRFQERYKRLQEQREKEEAKPEQKILRHLNKIYPRTACIGDLERIVKCRHLVVLRTLENLLDKGIIENPRPWLYGLKKSNNKKSR